MKARDVMTTPAIVLRPEREAAALLCAHGFTSAPVVDSGRRLIGMATRPISSAVASRRTGGRSTTTPIRRSRRS